MTAGPGLWVGDSDLGLTAGGEAMLVAETELPAGPTGLRQHARALVSLGNGAVEFLDVLAGQVLIASLAGQADRYSRKVQQPVRIWPDWHTRSGTVTCGDRH